MNIKKLINKYRKIIDIFYAPFIAVIIYLLLFVPAKRNLSLLQRQYKKYTDIMADAGITHSLFSKKPPQESSSVAKRLGQSEEMLSQNETESINNISKLCYKLNIELASITPLKKEIALDASNKEITAGERKVLKTTIKLSLMTNFGNLVKFIEESRKTKNIIVLNKITINKADILATASDRLKVELEISAFNLANITL